MKTTSKLLLTMLALGASAIVASAQDNKPPGDGSQNGPQQGPPNGRRMPPAPAIIGALDANHDGVIDADEIANASAVLKSLDKNGDGKLTPEEFDGRPRPPLPDGQMNGRGGPNSMPPRGGGPNGARGGNFDGPRGGGFDGPPGGNGDRPPGPPPGDE